MVLSAGAPRATARTHRREEINEATECLMADIVDIKTAIEWWRCPDLSL